METNELDASGGSPGGPGDDPWTGQPCASTRRQVAALRAVRAVTNLLGLSFQRTFAPLMATSVPPRSVTARLTVEWSEFSGWPVYYLRTSAPSKRMVVGIHGGAFTVEPTRMHWRDYAAIAHDTNAAVVVPIYPLVPNGTAATVVPLMADLVAGVIDQPDVESLSLYGDSAGATLALAAVQELVLRGSRIPDSMVLISPVLDLTFANPECKTVDDPVLLLDEVRAAGKLWADTLDLADPRVSPLYGSLEGLPPTTVYAGSADILGPDVLRLRDRAMAQNADMSFVLRKGLIHDWALPNSREGKQVRPQIYRQVSGLRS